MDSRSAYLAFLAIHRQNNTAEIIDLVDKLEIGLNNIGLGDIYGSDKIISSIVKTQEKFSKDRLMFREMVTEDVWAYAWARDIGDAEHMRQFVNSSSIAPYWAKCIGDVEYMKQFVTDRNDITHWNRLFPDNQIAQPTK